MDEPTDPLARQLALSALTTEHFNLQSARIGTIAEANGRSALYLGTLSSAVIAIAFVGQARGAVGRRCWRPTMQATGGPSRHHATRRSR
jgi:hypothetical protein